MNPSETLTLRNQAFATERFAPGLRMMPSLKTIVIACVDPRVDPAGVLGAEPGELAVLRNVGGRVTPGTVEELVLLRAVTQAAGGDLGPGWELIVLQHTDCGITRLQDQPEGLTAYLGSTDLTDLTDPHMAVAHDLALLRGEARLPGVAVAGLVYDVGTGRVETVA